MRKRLMVAGLYGMSALFHTSKLPAAGETVNGNSLVFEGGGKGYNQAVSASRMGADTLFVTALGDDMYGRSAETVFSDDGLKSWKIIVKPGVSTAFAAVCTDQCGENIVVVHPGAIQGLTESDVAALEQDMMQCKALLLQMEMAPDINEYLIDLALKYQLQVILNPAPAKTESRHLLKKAHFVTPNYGEALLLCGYDIESRVEPERLCREIQQQGCKNVIITLGKEGCCALEENGTFSYQRSFSVETVDTVGAGDTFNGAFAAALLGQYKLSECIKIATAASAISVTKRGAVAGIPWKEDVAAFLKKELGMGYENL